MKTKLFAFIALMLLPLGMAAQSDPVEARLKAKYGFARRHGDGTSTFPFYYSVKRDGKWGACDANGREIIPPRYDDVCRHGEGTSTSPFYYTVERDGKEGACDANGREIIPPVYDDGVIYSDVFEAKINGEWVSLGIGLTPDGTAKGTYTPARGYEAKSSASSSSSSRPSSSASTTSSSSPSSKPDGLLYSGLYTESGGEYGNDFTVSIEIYKDYILVFNERYDFSRTSYGNRVYSGSKFGAHIDYYVDSNFNMYKVMTQNSWNGSGTFSNRIDMAKGECTMPKYHNSGGGNYDGGSIGGSSVGNRNQRVGGSTSTKSCRVCTGTGLCRTCNGKGRYYDTYLGNNRWKDCPNCTNGRCTSCGGTGRR